MSNDAPPIAVGLPPLNDVNRRRSTPTDPIGLLTGILQAIGSLVTRLAPPQSMVKVQFLATALSTKQTYNLNSPINNIVSTLTKGVVNVYFGPGSTGVPDYTFSPSGVPASVHFPVRSENSVTVVVDSASPDPATGCLYFQCY